MKSQYNQRTVNDKKSEVSVIIAVKNEEKNLADCLKLVNWVDEIIVIDTGSIDKTIRIAKSYTKKIFRYGEGSYADWKNYGANKSTSKWILFLDADERVDINLKKEIEGIIYLGKTGAYALPRKNIILGRFMKHGGWWPDYVIRFFDRKSFLGWQNILHEQPKYKGKLNYFKNPLIHLKHNNLEEMIDKSNIWSETEAKLLFDNGHPAMSWWRFIRIMISEFYLRMIRKMGFLDGVEGIIYSLYQAWYRFMVYAKLWEMQINTSLLNTKLIKSE